MALIVTSDALAVLGNTGGGPAARKKAEGGGVGVVGGVWVGGLCVGWGEGRGLGGWGGFGVFWGFWGFVGVMFVGGVWWRG